MEAGISPMSKNTKAKKPRLAGFQSLSRNAQILVAVIGLVGTISAASIPAILTYLQTNERIDATAKNLDQRLRNLSGIDVKSGSETLGESDPGWTLLTPPKDATANYAARKAVKKVSFEPPFSGQPFVFVAVNFVDADKDVNLRYAVYANDITPRGFDLVFQTWADTKIHTIGVNWLAYQR
jgi:hypothetical protein